MEQVDLLLIGLGDLGAVTLELLAREPSIGSILVGSRNIDHGQARCNLARIGAMAQGYTPDIQFLELDLEHSEATSRLIQKRNPRIILCTASMMTWWLPALFPDDQQELLKRAGFGAWLPIHLTLPMKLMVALDRIDYQGFTLIAPFPDVVNPILNAIGMPPAAGIGNLDEIVPKIRYLGAQKMEVDPDTLRITLVAHHALEGWVFGKAEGDPPPYYLRVEHQGVDVTEAIEGEDLLFATYPITGGPAWNYLSGGSVVRLIKALLSGQESRLHVPGPDGLPGGYPVQVSGAGIRLDLPADLSLDNAIAINERSHPYDGIEAIEADGTVVFSETTTSILSKLIGFSVKRMKAAESEAYANELLAKFYSFAKKQGVKLPV
jgi:hypothetical protein